jgi:hypothetical protein
MSGPSFFGHRLTVVMPNSSVIEIEEVGAFLDRVVRAMLACNYSPRCTLHTDTPILNVLSATLTLSGL